jgi:hypothetical protein
MPGPKHGTNPKLIRSRIAATASRVASLNALNRSRKRALDRLTRRAPRVREGLDYVSLEPARAKALGARFVMRYLSHALEGHNPKDITSAERKRLHEQGIAVGFVWETTADRAKRGREAGKLDAQSARTRLRTMGAPAGTAVYFAVDFDTAGHPGVVDDYFKGAREELGSVVGVYGSFEVVKHLREALGIRWLWQTYAWSRSRILRRTLWYGPAQVQQYRNRPQWDHDRSTVNDISAWEAPAR